MNQTGLILIKEQEGGLKANLLRAYHTHPICEDDFFSSVPPNSGFPSLVYALCLLHAVAIERTLYVHKGWNANYKFSDSDLAISAAQLQVNRSFNIEWELQYGL